MTPRASFIIPAYNAERWISKAIWSCRNQTIKQIEIIVVNDGSEDGTQDICEWHLKEDPRVKVFNTLNKGRSSARNSGNELATSNILMVLDADDMATRDRAKHTIAAFQLKKADLVYGSFFAVDSLGTTTQKIASQPFDADTAKSKKMNFICHSTMAYTKKLAKSIHYADGVYTKLGLDDWKFQWDAYKHGAVIKNIKSPLCYYRVTNDNTMATRDPKEVERVKEEYLANV